MKIRSVIWIDLKNSIDNFNRKLLIDAFNFDVLQMIFAQKTFPTVVLGVSLSLLLIIANIIIIITTLNS